MTHKSRSKTKSLLTCKLIANRFLRVAQVQAVCDNYGVIPCFVGQSSNLPKLLVPLGCGAQQNQFSLLADNQNQP